MRNELSGSIRDSGGGHVTHLWAREVPIRGEEEWINQEAVGFQSRKLSEEEQEESSDSAAERGRLS